jgi:integrase
MRVKLTPVLVQKAPKSEHGDSFFWDTALPGFGLKVSANGHRSFVVQYRAKGISRRLTIKAAPAGGLSLDKAKREARAVLGAVARGGDPVADKRRAEREQRDTLGAIVEEYITREGAKLRSGERRADTLRRLILPVLGSRPIDDIKRSEIIRLLDKIADENGPAAADTALAALRRVLNWFEGRSDDYVSPVRKGMARTGDRSRQRILSDDELRRLWRAIEAQPDAFGRMVQFLLLTAARRDEVRCMRYDEVSNGVWTIPSHRYKSAIDHVVPLSTTASAVLTKLPRIGSMYVYTSDGRKALGGISRRKRQMDDRSGVTDWRLHDLRRTARSLLSRAGTSADIAERCLGHVMSGVRGVYDRHQYQREKLQAFEELASLVENIVNPKPNVTPLLRVH